MGLVQCDGVLQRRGDKDVASLRDDRVRAQGEEAAIYAPEREASGDTRTTELDPRSAAPGPVRRKQITVL